MPSRMQLLSILEVWMQTNFPSLLHREFQNPIRNSLVLKERPHTKASGILSGFEFLTVIKIQ